MNSADQILPCPSDNILLVRQRFFQLLIYYYQTSPNALDQLDHVLTGYEAFAEVHDDLRGLRDAYQGLQLIDPTSPLVM